MVDRRLGFGVWCKVGLDLYKVSLGLIYLYIYIYIILYSRPGGLVDWCMRPGM